MAKTRYIQVRLTNNQYERICNNAQAKGYRTLSSYLRHVALDRDLIFDKHFLEIHKIITGKNN